MVFSQFPSYPALDASFSSILKWSGVYPLFSLRTALVPHGNCRDGIRASRQFTLRQTEPCSRKSIHESTTSTLHADGPIVHPCLQYILTVRSWLLNWRFYRACRLMVCRIWPLSTRTRPPLTRPQPRSPSKHPESVSEFIEIAASLVYFISAWRMEYLWTILSTFISLFVAHKMLENIIWGVDENIAMREQLKLRNRVLTAW